MICKHNTSTAINKLMLCFLKCYIIERNPIFDLQELGVKQTVECFSSSVKCDTLREPEAWSLWNTNIKTLLFTERGEYTLLQTQVLRLLTVRDFLA